MKLFGFRAVYTGHSIKHGQWEESAATAAAVFRATFYGLMELRRRKRNASSFCAGPL